MPDPRPVMIAAGGTGGHVYPALAVAEILKLRNVPVVWLGTRAGLEARVVPAAGVDIEWVDVTGLRGKNLLHTAIAPLKLMRACFQAWRIISRRKPGAILGMGGFVAGPGGLVAVLRRLPLCIHEQNSVAGMTNRYLARFAERVFTAFPGVLTRQADVQQVGNPVREDIAKVGGQLESGQAKTESASTPCNVLVVGGSLGARVLNQKLPGVFAAMSVPFRIRHQSGSPEHATTVSAYEAAGVDAQVDAFLDDMAAAYAWADLVICRAGAMTVSELSAAGAASVLVPYPHAVDDHQTGNALWLVDADAALIQQQKDFDEKTLSSTLDTLLKDRSRLVQMSENARGLYQPGAAERVADALQELAS